MKNKKPGPAKAISSQPTAEPVQSEVIASVLDDRLPFHDEPMAAPAPAASVLAKLNDYQRQVLRDMTRGAVLTRIEQDYEFFPIYWILTRQALGGCASIILRTMCGNLEQTGLIAQTGEGPSDQRIYAVTAVTAAEMQPAAPELAEVACYSPSLG